MSLDVHIGTLESRYHLPPRAFASGASDASDTPARLDRLWRQTLEDGLPAVLARLGVGPDEVVCFRHLHVPMTLALDASEPSLVEQWSQALAATVGDAMNANGSDLESAVVRYPNPVAAVVDVARQVVSGDLTRFWTWRHLDLGLEADLGAGAVPRVDEARLAEAVIAACERRPEATLPVVLSLAATPGHLARLVAHTASVDGWTRLAKTALTMAGGDVSAWSQAASSSVAGSSSVAPLPAGGTAVMATKGARTLLAVARSRPDLFGNDPRSCRATATLALLVADPGAGRRTLPRPQNAVQAVDASARSPLIEACEVVRRACAAAGSVTAPSSDPDERSEADAGSNGTRSDPPGRDPDTPPQALGEPSDGWTAAPLRRPTQWGGLLFLVHLLHDSPLLDAMTASTLARRYGLRWCLLVLARALVTGAKADAARPGDEDPSLLAFAGLGPDADVPDQGRPVAGAEGRMVRVWAATVRAMLVARLAPIPAVATHEIVARTCRRGGVLVADPGWIELRLPLGSVDLSVRRSGLDLDPGWVPWLGVVIKITYTAEATL